MVNVRIHLDRQDVGAFTNLDVVRGSVLLSLSSEENVAAIQVKLEGISRTKFQVPKNPAKGEKGGMKTVIESHKLLYITQDVFPPPDLQELKETVNVGKDGYTLPPGSYSYPFSFRIPINNNCKAQSNVISRFLDVPDETRHIITTLPPSFSEVEEGVIKYFFKVTVRKPKFYQRNARQLLPFVFLPIEPPRLAKSDALFYARRKHSFFYLPNGGYAPADPKGQQPKKKSKFGSVLRAITSGSSRTTYTREVGPAFYFEARMPDARIIVPGELIPLKLYITAPNSIHFTVPIFLHRLCINLVATTELMADINRKTSVLMLNIANIENMSLKMGTSNQSRNQQQDLEAEFNLAKWAEFLVLPDTVPPTFKTCNISRSYNLEVLADISHGSYGGIDTMELGFEIQVYSGIKPPDTLVQTSTGPFSPSPYAPVNVANADSEAGIVSYAAASDSKQDGSAAEMDPPTYSEAIASNIAPINGPRRAYQQGPSYFTGIEELDNEKS
ncbi:uncharacterized protein V1516DRAFT_675889 [Lipomyces oligophaga]|uniref:uncharacterized protein n=1 Tax=Lipomyces oligophaga TaxID=45792 RepID=UPI0034CE36FF